jgi:zinc protease
MSSMMRTEPAMLAQNKLDRALSSYGPDDVRYVPTPEENAKRLAAVTLEQIVGLYEKQIGATQAELGVVGDFDPDATLAAVRDILRDWKSNVPVRRIERTVRTDLVGSRDEILTPDKANAEFRAGIVFPLKETDAEFAAMRIGTFMFGGSTLSSRLGNRIREKEGLSYGVTSQFMASPCDPEARFTVVASTNPVNIDRVEKSVAEELELFLRDGPSLSELADAQKAYLEAQKVSRAGDAGLAGQIVTNMQLNRTFAHSSELEKKIAALSPDDVKAAFRKYIDPKKLVIIRAGDFKKQK